MKAEELEKNQADLVGYLWLIWSRKWLVVLVALGVFGISIWRTLRTEPLYEAMATIQLNLQRSGMFSDQLRGFMGESKSLETDIEILKSRVMAEKAVVRLGRLYSLGPVPPGMSLELTGVTVTDKATPGVYVLSFIDDSGQYRVGDPEGNAIGVGRVGQAFEHRGVSFTVSMVSAKVGSSVQIHIRPLTDLGEPLRGRVSATPIKSTNIIALRVKMNNPREAARTVNAFAEAYVDFTREQNLRQLISVREFLERQLVSFGEDLLKVGEELGKTGKEGYEVALKQLTMESTKAKLAERLVGLEMQRVAMRFTYAPNHSAFVRVEREIEEIRDQLTKQLRPGKQDLPLLKLLQGSHAKLAMYNYMLQKQQEIRLAEASELGSARVIDRALPPAAPISPDVSRTVKVGGLAGLSLGIGLALLLGYLDHSVKSIKDVEDRLGLPVFGVIPDIGCEDRGDRLMGWIRKRESADAARLDSRAAQVLEAYRSLRTHIRVAVSGASSRTLLFTSPGPGEGKSLTVANLAIAMSQKEGRVLVVDCDLRKPDQSKLFKVADQAGISEVLAGKQTWRQVTQPTKFENIDVLPCGGLPPDPAELIAQHVMKEFLEEAQKHYSLVLIDSPPALPFTDACVLAPLVSGVLLVVRSRATSAEAIARVQSMLNTVEARLIAVILNGVRPADEVRYYGYYSYKKYGASGKSQARSKRRIRQAAQRVLRHVRSA